MSRRLLLPFLSALALLLLAAPASRAAAPAAVPAADGADDVDALCDDDWSQEGSDDWGDETDDTDAAEAEIASDDDCDEALAAPLLTKLSAKLAGRGRGARLTVAFTLDLPGEVALTLRRTETGTTSGKRCVAAVAKRGAKGKAAKGRGGRKGKRCSRTVPLPGTAYVDGDAGANSFAVTTWKARSLKPGAYTLTATPTDDGGAAVAATFSIDAR